MYTPTDTPMILDMELDVHHRMLDINARAYTTLIHTVGNRMRERNRGSIVIVSSDASVLFIAIGASAAISSLSALVPAVFASNINLFKAIRK